MVDKETRVMDAALDKLQNNKQKKKLHVLCSNDENLNLNIE